MLEAALAYARMGWKVFPLHTIVDGRCSCGKVACKSPGKHPRTARGFKEASTDPDQIKRWWGRWKDANIGVATGDGLVVVDVDGPEGAAELKAVVAANQPLPATLVAQTGSGVHLVFAARPGAPELRSAARDHVHVRAAGGYIVASPSRHASGRTYQWVKKHPIAEIPEWLRQWLSGYEVARKPAETALGPLPAYLQGNTRDISALADQALKSVYSPSEHARVASALQSIDVKSCSYDDFLRVGMALKELDWQKPDGTDIGFELWDAWCSLSEHHNPEGLEFKWKSFRRSGVSVGSLYHMAQQHGWTGGAPAPVAPSTVDHGSGLNGTANGVNGNHALPAAFLAASQGAIFWPDPNEKGQPRSTCTNAGVAVTALEILCEKDKFHDKLLTGGHMIEQWEGDLSDDVIQMLRKTIRARFGFDPGEKNVRDACVQLCLENAFDPILDYLNALKWDGVPRLDSWLLRYMGAPDTELNRMIGRLVLIAAVRRQYAPGTKFDQIVVLESKEGFGKSTAIEIMAGKENFSDQSILNKMEREQQEAMTGVWLYEIADLTGMKKTEIEHIKAFASRTSDRARPAYGRFRVDRPRRTIFFATTNDDEYLQSQTGNRRFWPVPVSRVDLVALRADRDQLWAEAVAYEKRGDSIVLPERLWNVASHEQDSRTESDEWSAAIHNYLNMADKLKQDVSITDVLVDNQFLRIESGRVGRREQMRAGNILRRLGFTKYRKRLSGNAFEYRYKR